MSSSDAPSTGANLLSALNLGILKEQFSRSDQKDRWMFYKEHIFSRDVLLPRRLEEGDPSSGSAAAESASGNALQGER